METQLLGLIAIIDIRLQVQNRIHCRYSGLAFMQSVSSSNLKIKKRSSSSFIFPFCIQLHGQRGPAWDSDRDANSKICSPNTLKGFAALLYHCKSVVVSEMQRGLWVCWEHVSKQMPCAVTDEINKRRKLKTIR